MQPCDVKSSTTTAWRGGPAAGSGAGSGWLDALARERSVEARQTDSAKERVTGEFCPAKAVCYNSHLR